MNARTFLLWISPLVIASAFIGIVVAKRESLAAAGERLYWNDSLFREVRGVVGRDYVEGISEERSRRLFYASVQAYLKGLDRYCHFYTPEDYGELEQDTKGEFGGIGVMVRTEADGALLVTAAREGYPAWEAGIRPGDRIVEIGGVPTASLETGELHKRLKGEVGTTVDVGVTRDGGTPVTRTLTRAVIRIESVLGIRLVDDEHHVGYLRVNSFLENTVEDFRRALERLKADGAKAIILDLRQNDGGVLKTAVAMVDCFLARGEIVIQRGRGETDLRVDRANEEGTIFREESLVVLVDARSASASEIVAGALQDHRRAVLVGERTYGKFLVQTLVSLPVGEGRAAVKLTTAKYLTPFGRFLQRDDEKGVRGGLLPEVNVPLSDEALASLRVRWEREAAPGWHRMDGADDEEEADDVADVQLAAAIDLLRGVAVVERIADGSGR